MNPTFRRALTCARRYRALGLCPLPSKMDIKGPDLPSYAQYWADPVPDSVFTEAGWRTTNLQVMTGAKTPGAVKVIVVDCDGPEAIEVWDLMCLHHDYHPTSAWVSRTGSGGRHTYFRLPEGTAECPGGMIWGLWDTYGEKGKGRWAKHKEVRILGDNALAIAPPSVHVETGRHYAFEPALSPNEIDLPEVAPAWLLAMPRLVPAPRCVPEPPKSEHVIKPPIRPAGASFRREAVLAAIPDKIALARSWGLQTASQGPNPSGWVACYAVGRDDRTPSASFHAADGTYQDRKDLRAVSLFDLGVELNRFHSWQECRDWCGETFIGRKQAPAYRTEYRGAAATPGGQR